MKEVGGGPADDHNILYGMWRNLIGGSVFSILLCLCNIAVGYFVFPSQELIVVSVILLVLYVALLVFNKPILVSSAEDYARQLVAEYMDTAM